MELILRARLGDGRERENGFARWDWKEAFFFLELKCNGHIVYLS